MKTSITPYSLSIGGSLSALAILFQSFPVFLPGLGLFMSPLSTLPIALSAFISPTIGIISYISSTLILFLISPQEAIIFMLTTGLLGLLLGATYRKGFILSLTLSAMTLSIGIGIMTFVLGIAAFGDMTPSHSYPLAYGLFILFSFIYSGVWKVLLRLFIGALTKFNVFNNLHN